MIEIVITEENELIRLGLKAALHGTEGMEVLGDYANTCEMFPFLATLTPDVALVSSAELVAFGPIISEYFDTHSPETKILALCENVRDEEILAVLRSGASGYVLGGVGVEKLTGYIRIVASGGMCFDPRAVSSLITRQVDPRLVPSAFRTADLTEREMLILAQLARGHTNLEIGTILYLSRSTVRNNITRIKNKLGVESRVELAVITVLQGIVSSGEY